MTNPTDLSDLFVQGGISAVVASDLEDRLVQVDQAGNLVNGDGEVISPTPTDGTALSGVSYDGSNRCTGFTLNGVTYTITGWGSTTVVVSGSDSSTRTITLDGSGRISGVA